MIDEKELRKQFEEKEYLYIESSGGITYRVDSIGSSGIVVEESDIEDVLNLDYILENYKLCKDDNESPKIYEFDKDINFYKSQRGEIAFVIIDSEGDILLRKNQDYTLIKFYDWA